MKWAEKKDVIDFDINLFERDGGNRFGKFYFTPNSTFMDFDVPWLWFLISEEFEDDYIIIFEIIFTTNGEFFQRCEYEKQYEKSQYYSIGPRKLKDGLLEIIL